MAEGHAQQVLEKEVTCPLCLQTLQEPKKLPCDHVYCKACLQRLANRSFNTASISCPECRALTQVTNGDVNNLPTAFRLNRLIEAFQHVQLVREETDSQSAATAATEEAAKCKVHQSQPLVLYCETCRLLLCRDCILATKDHSDHHYGFVNEMKENLQKKLMDTASSVEGQSGRVSKAVEKISLVESDIVLHKSNCQREIDESFEALYRTLQKHQQIMKERVAEQLKTAKFEEKKKELTSIQSEVSTVVGQASQSVQEGELDFLMQHFPIIQQRLEQLQEKLSKTPLNVPDRPQFITTKVLGDEVLEQLLEKHNGLHSFDPTKWQASGRFLTEAQVGKKYTLTVESNKGHGKLWRASSSQKRVVKLEAELVCVRDKSTTQVEIQEHSQDRFTVKIQPLVRGRHKLSIKVNGVNISNSPFDVFVHIPAKQLSKPVAEIPGLQYPGSVCYSQERILVSEINSVKLNSGRIFKIPTDTTIHTTNTTTLLNLNGVGEITTDPQSGAMFVTTIDKHEVHKFTKNRDLLKTIGGLGSQPGQFIFPNGLRVSRQSELYICDSYNHRVQIFNLDLNFKRVLGTDSSSLTKAWPSDVDFDSIGNIYIVCSRRHSILVFSPAEQLLCTIGGERDKPFYRPLSLVFYNELMYVTEVHSYRVSVITTSGELVTRFGNSYLQGPEGIAIDEDGFLYVTSHYSKILIF